MPRATLDDVVQLLRDKGANEHDTRTIVYSLTRAGLNPPQMRTWLSHPARAHSVSVGLFLAPGIEWRQVPTHAIEGGRVDAVIDAAAAFSDAEADERWICLTLGCYLEQAQRLTRCDPERTAAVIDILTRLKNALRKPSVIYETLQQTLSGTFDDDTRLVDWMLDERLYDARDALVTGRIDPVTLSKQDALAFHGW